MTTTTINSTDVLSAVNTYVQEQSRPCPAAFLTEKFGADVLDVIDQLKASGVVVGLRGRNGGLALAGSDIVTKRAEHAAKKAAKAAAEPAVSSEVAVVESSAA